MGLGRREERIVMICITKGFLSVTKGMKDGKTSGRVTEDVEQVSRGDPSFLIMHCPDS